MPFSVQVEAEGKVLAVQSPRGTPHQEWRFVTRLSPALCGVILNENSF